jgi:hypothetical protein
VELVPRVGPHLSVTFCVLSNGWAAVNGELRRTEKEVTVCCKVLFHHFFRGAKNHGNPHYIVTCTPIARHRVGKQVPAKTDSS